MLRTSESCIVWQVVEHTEASRRVIEDSMERSMLALERNLRSHIDQRVEDCLAEVFSRSLLETDAAQTLEDHRLESESCPRHPLLRNTDWDTPDLSDQRNSDITPVRSPDRPSKFTVPLSNRLSCTCSYHSGMRSVGPAQKWEVSWLQQIPHSLRSARHHTQSLSLSLVSEPAPSYSGRRVKTPMATQEDQFDYVSSAEKVAPAIKTPRLTDVCRCRGPTSPPRLDGHVER